jgi:hypothetical protein
MKKDLPHKPVTIIAFCAGALLMICVWYLEGFLSKWYLDVVLVGFVLMTVTLPFDRVVLSQWFNLHFLPEMVSLFGFGYFGAAVSLQLVVLLFVLFLSFTIFTCEKKTTGGNDWVRSAGKIVAVLSGPTIVGLILGTVIGR